MEKYVCSVCGYVYDEQKEKIKYADLPDDWTCPMCGVSKSFFKPEEKKEIKKSVKPKQATEKTVEEAFSEAELYVLCTNLAKGCEKQYMFEEATLFMEIADYYNQNTKKINEKSIEEIINSLNNDLEKNYVESFTQARKEKDRGALRALTWSEKVTRVLNGLLERYKKEGKSFLKEKKIFVCQICGFIYIGTSSPNVCPVCKVPKLKIQEIGGLD